MLADYSELEEENIHLQKQVSMLKHNQIEFEGMKHMNKRLQEDINDLQCHIEELNNLKRISEKQVEECLENLKIEREQRHALKKELDQKRDQESLLQLSKMHQFDNLNFSDQDMDSSLHNLEQDLMNEGNESSSNRPGRRKPSPPRNNLFSVVGELEERLEKTENEKNDLERKIEEYQSSLKVKADEIAKLTAKLNSNNIAKNIDTILNDIPGGDVSPPGEILENGVDADSNNVNSQHHVLVLKQVVKEQEKKYLAAMQQISEMEQRLSSSTSAPSLSNNASSAASSVCPAPDLAQLGLAWQVKNYEEKLLQLKKDLNAAEKSGSESTAQLKSTQHELYEISQEISQIYNLCCFAVGKPPNKSLVDQVKQLQEDKKMWQSAAEGEEGEDGRATTTEEGGVVKESELQRVNHERALEAIRDQIKYLKRVCENVSDVARAKSGDDADGEQTSDAAELTEQVGKLKSLLSTKREQIATLRTVLKANKHTAEVALANLKSKYENEKSIVTETMLKLRNELKALKEDAATFASLRAMFAARCDEYVTQLDELQRQLAAAEEEKKTLNSLLRMAIQQKLSLTQRLEDLEMDRERLTARLNEGGGGGSRTGGGRRGGRGDSGSPVGGGGSNNNGGGGGRKARGEDGVSPGHHPYSPPSKRV